MEIIEGNKLIAEFMGGVKREITNREFLRGEKPFTVYDIPGRGAVVENFQYHSSFDWLMPVVEKINKSGIYSVEISFLANGTNPIYQCNISKCEWPEQGVFKKEKICGKGGRLKKPIEPVWECVIEFIQWYNTQSKPTPQ